MGNVRLYGATSGYTELAPPAVAPDGVLTLPSGTGTIAKTTDQGLVHINTTTFSAVSSVSLNNVFTSTFSNYRVLIEAQSSVNVDTFIRYRVGGSDNSVATYQTQYVDFNGTLEDANRATNQTSNLVGICGSASDGNFMTIDIARPNLAQRTVSISNSLGINNGGYVRQSSTYFDNTTVFDGFSHFVNSGTITGTVRVYGYKNS